VKERGKEGKKEKGKKEGKRVRKKSRKELKRAEQSRTHHIVRLHNSSMVGY